MADIDPSIDVTKITPSLRVALRHDNYELHKILPNKGKLSTPSRFLRPFRFFVRWGQHDFIKSHSLWALSRAFSVPLTFLRSVVVVHPARNVGRRMAPHVRIHAAACAPTHHPHTMPPHARTQDRCVLTHPHTHTHTHAHPLLRPLTVDPLVSLMMVEKVPDSTYEMVGGLDKQIKEIKEVIELPVKHPELFEALGIAQPKVRDR